MKKRSTVSKSKSFNMRASSNTTNNKRNSNTKMRQSNSSINNNNTKGNKRIPVIRSYSELQNIQGVISLSDDDSCDSDNANDTTMNSSHGSNGSSSHTDLDLSHWTGGLPTMMMMDSSSQQRHASKRSARFRPSYLLQRRKQGLAQHNSPVGMPIAAGTMHAKARRHSIVAVLFFLTACYALLSLSGTNGPPTPLLTPIHQQRPIPSYPKTTQHYYYLNMKESQPHQIVSKMLLAHAYAFHQGGRFGGVCGYPTYQQEAQQAALGLLAQLNLEMELAFDVCPPIEAILNQDDHYHMMEEQQVVSAAAAAAPTATTGRSQSIALFTKEWIASMKLKRKSAVSNNPNESLWQQIMTGQIPPPSSSLKPQQRQPLLEQAHAHQRRLRGVSPTHP